MDDGVLWHRIQFAFTISFHYLFPQLTMGLVLIILLLKTFALATGKTVLDECARFWGKIFGINFALGVVTGIPLEFQFGTNWGKFSNFAGGIIGQTLAMEGVFAFFLESTFLGLFLFGEKRLGRFGHWLATLALFLGSWLSGYFIIATNAFMQHPAGHELGPDGSLQLANFGAFVLNPWAIWQYAHNMAASVVTGSFVVASVGAYWTLMKQHSPHARVNLRIGVVAGLVSSMVVAFPTGDEQGKLLAQHQPVTMAAVEGQFKTEVGAPLAIIGQPDVRNERLENPIFVPGALSFLAYGHFNSPVHGLSDFPRDEWPDNIELIYYAYHIMVGLGTLFIMLMAIASFEMLRGRLERSRRVLWLLMLAVPFPYIATTAGWWTAEVGRQPWIVYGLMRTNHGGSPLVHAGDVVFTVLGFIGLYLMLGFLGLFLALREVAHGPATREAPAVS